MLFFGRFERLLVKCFDILKTLIDDSKLEVDDDVPIPLYNVDSTILEKVIEWATHHKDYSAPTEYNYPCLIPSWDVQFLKVDKRTLLQLIMAANYLDITRLLNVTCQTVANLMKNKTAHEIRQMFHIKNDFTQAEMKKIRKHNDW